MIEDMGRKDKEMSLPNLDKGLGYTDTAYKGEHVELR